MQCVKSCRLQSDTSRYCSQWWHWAVVMEDMLAVGCSLFPSELCSVEGWQCLCFLLCDSHLWRGDSVFTWERSLEFSAGTGLVWCAQQSSAENKRSYWPEPLPQNADWHWSTKTVPEDIRKHSATVTYEYCSYQPKLLVLLEDGGNRRRASREHSPALFVPTCVCVFGEAFVPCRTDKKKAQ